MQLKKKQVGRPRKNKNKNNKEEEEAPIYRPNDENMLKAIRMLKNISQERAAKRVGVSRTVWYTWEAKIRPLSVAHLFRIQQRLNLTDDQTIAIVKWWGESQFVADADDLTIRSPFPSID